MQNQPHNDEPFILAVVSGKGGAGKSMICVNTAEMLNRMGYKVALIDADLGLANCATLLNEPVSASVTNWVTGDCILGDILHHYNGITLVTGSDEPVRPAVDPELMMDGLDQVMMHLAKEHDFIIIDTPAGAGEMTLWGLDRAHAGTLILIDEPTAISDVYRLCKYVYGIDPGYTFSSIVNYAENEEAAESTLERFNNILSYFLKKQISCFGFIPHSNDVRESVRSQQTLLQTVPGSPIIGELQFISENIIGLANKTLQPTSNSVI